MEFQALHCCSVFPFSNVQPIPAQLSLIPLVSWNVLDIVEDLIIATIGFVLYEK